MLTLYEYIDYNQLVMIVHLRRIGLLECIDVPRKVIVSREEVPGLMRHDKWRRVRGVIRQLNRGGVST